jgi:hypothetical protein
MNAMRREERGERRRTIKIPKCVQYCRVSKTGDVSVQSNRS